MSNNVNSYIAQRLFAYMQYGSDMTQGIADVYRNSMIFIGDQKQIWVPRFGAYVGIGTTAYEGVLNRIAAAEQSIAQIQQTNASGTVSSLLVQYNDENVDEHGVTQYGKLSGDVTITGIGDYNAETGFAYTTHMVYTYSNGTGSFSSIGPENSGIVNATSGITLTYRTAYSNEEIGGQVVKKPLYHQLVIDDKQTWSYMTAAYSYSLQFSRDYTTNRIETLYHDLLGVGTDVMVPIAYEDMFVLNDATGQAELIPGQYYSWTGDGNAYIGNANATGWTLLAGNPTSGTQYYTKSTNYSNSYNMNISDGIQTLREVAYMLDKLTDGGLGKVTYMTYEQWNAATTNSTELSHAVTLYQYDANDASKTYTGTIWRVITNSGKPTTNHTKYAYYSVDIDPENLGIQMAYSIAGNNADIQDLHDHVNLAEGGSTTVRSISNINDTTNPNNLITVTQWTNNSFVQTDTNKSLPNGDGITYQVGDIASFVSLDLADTYVTSNVTTLSDNLSGIIGDVNRKGIYEKVNFLAELPTLPAAPDSNNNKYYKYENGSMQLITSANDWPSTAPAALALESRGHNYYILREGAVAYTFANDTFEKLTVEYYGNNTSETFYEQTNDGHFVVASGVTASNATNYYRKTSSNTSDYVQHAVIDNNNHIATTAWVTAFNRDSQSAITEQINDILQDAYEYTDRAIGKLDNDTRFSYEDFNEWQTANNINYDGLVAGTPEYDAAVKSNFTTFVNDVTNGTGTVLYSDSSYTFNLVRSQYISYISEENGIVNVGTKELPTDQLQITTTVWSSQEDGTEFVPHTLTDTPENDDANISDKAEQLFALAADNQLYYLDTNSKVYVEAPRTGLSDADYYELSNDGTYVQASAETILEYKDGHTNSPKWRQLYKQESAYCELLIGSIKADDSLTDNTKISVKYRKVDGTIGTLTLSNLSTVYTKTYKATGKKYLTGSVQHYSYNDSIYSNGENRINLNVNITNIEEATAYNTGFADAYDVKNYIENMFEWVNLSASITSLNNDDFYEEYIVNLGSSFDNDAHAIAVDIYQKNGANNYSKVTTANAYAFAKYTDSPNTEVPYTNETNIIAGSARWALSTDGTASGIYTGYTLKHGTNYNGINMVLHTSN